jgi:hypothetical protein
MRKFNTLVAIAAVSILTLSACKKEATTPPVNNKPEASKEELLAGTGQKSWHLTKYVENGVDRSSEMKSCEMDNNYIYKADKTYALDAGASKCSSSEKQTLETATWWFSNDHANLYQKYEYMGQAMTITYVVKELKENSMVLSMTYGDKTYEHTYTAQ